MPVFEDKPLHERDSRAMKYPRRQANHDGNYSRGRRPLPGGVPAAAVL